MTPGIPDLCRGLNVSLVLNRCNEGDRLTSGGNDSYAYTREQSALVPAEQDR
jgi:hypothetical protein